MGLNILFTAFLQYILPYITGTFLLFTVLEQGEDEKKMVANRKGGKIKVVGARKKEGLRLGRKARQEARRDDCY